MAAIAAAGAALYYAGLLNSIVIQRPERPGAIAVVVAIGAALAVLIAAVRGTGLCRGPHRALLAATSRLRSDQRQWRAGRHPFARSSDFVFSQAGMPSRWT